MASRNEQFTLLVDGIINDAGILANPKLSQTFTAGRYRATFEVGEYYRSLGIVSSPNPFLNVVNYDFGIDVPEQHIHLPFKCTPWGYSCFRGGA